ncbi:hypothetical protein TUMEXPCC7403_02900 [Tumidithrix helvetica PCC 7403]
MGLMLLVYSETIEIVKFLYDSDRLAATYDGDNF